MSFRTRSSLDCPATVCLFMNGTVKMRGLPGNRCLWKRCPQGCVPLELWIHCGYELYQWRRAAAILLILSCCGLLPLLAFCLIFLQADTQADRHPVKRFRNEEVPTMYMALKILKNPIGSWTREREGWNLLSVLWVERMMIFSAAFYWEGTCEKGKDKGAYKAAKIITGVSGGYGLSDNTASVLGRG